MDKNVNRLRKQLPYSALWTTIMQKRVYHSFAKLKYFLAFKL